MARFVAHGFGVVVAMNLPVALGAVILEPQSRASLPPKRQSAKTSNQVTKVARVPCLLLQTTSYQLYGSQTLHLHDNCRKKADFMAKRKIAGDEFRVCFQAYRCEKR